MALPDFTGQNIENTYQRVLQTDGGELRDGTGSLVTLTSITSSNISLGANIIHTGDPDTSINFGVNSIRFQAGGELLYDAKSTGLDISRDITSSADISSSGTIIGSTGSFDNLSIGNQSNFVFHDDGPIAGEIPIFTNTNGRLEGQETFTLSAGDLTFAPQGFASGLAVFSAQGNSITLSAPITASGNISSSGTVTAASFVGTMDGGSF